MTDATNEFAALTPGIIKDEEVSPEDRGDIVTEEVEETEEVVEEVAEAEEPAAEETAEEPTAEAEEPAAEESEDDKGNIHKALKFERERRRQLEQELKGFKEFQTRMEAQQKPAPEPEKPQSFMTDEEFKAYTDAQLDGDNAKAYQIFNQAMLKVTEAAAERARRDSQQITEREFTQRQHMQELQAVANDIVKSYDVLNPDSAAYDEQLEAAVIQRRDLYIQAGIPPAVALKDAVTLMTAQMGIAPKAAKTETKPAVKKPNMQRKVELAAKQPPRVEGESDKIRKPIDITKMSDADFEKLSEEELAIARGDIIA